MSTAARRILVALDTSTGSRLALRRAADLARRLDAELSGLFVEDENLLHLAGLPFARELSASGAAARRLSPEAMERELARQAMLLEQELEQIAASLDLRWSFRTRRGRVAGELLAARAGHQLVALGRAALQPGARRLGSTARRLLSEPGLALVLIGPAPVRHDRVLAIFDRSPAARSALRQALELSSVDRPLQVLVRAMRREELASLRSDLRELAGPRTLEIHESIDDGPALMQCILRVAPDMLVVGHPGQEGAAELETLAAWFDGVVLRVPAPAAVSARR